MSFLSLHFNSDCDPKYVFLGVGAFSSTSVADFETQDLCFDSINQPRLPRVRA